MAAVVIRQVKLDCQFGSTLSRRERSILLEQKYFSLRNVLTWNVRNLLLLDPLLSYLELSIIMSPILRSSHLSLSLSMMVLSAVFFLKMPPYTMGLSSLMELWWKKVCLYMFSVDCISSCLKDGLDQFGFQRVHFRLPAVMGH